MKLSTPTSKRVEALFNRWCELDYFHGERAMGHFFGMLQAGCEPLTMAARNGRPMPISEVLDKLEISLEFGLRCQAATLADYHKRHPK